MGLHQFEPPLLDFVFLAQPAPILSDPVHFFPAESRVLDRRMYSPSSVRSGAAAHPLVLGSGFLWIAADRPPYWLLAWGHIPTGFRLWESLIDLIPIALALIVGVRRICVERYLWLDHDCMVLPIGLFQMGTAKIGYTSIRSVWRHYLNYAFVLHVATEEQTFKIMPGFLPDNESYCALEEFT